MTTGEAASNYINPPSKKWKKIPEHWHLQISKAKYSCGNNILIGMKIRIHNALEHILQILLATGEEA